MGSDFLDIRSYVEYLLKFHFILTSSQLYIYTNEQDAW